MRTSELFFCKKTEVCVRALTSSGVAALRTFLDKGLEGGQVLAILCEHLLRSALIAIKLANIIIS